MPLYGFLRSANAISWALALEGYHTLHYVITLLCRLADRFLPYLIARWLRCVLRRRRMLVRLASGMCIGERVPSVPFNRNRRLCKCFKFEGVPYATVAGDRFGPPQALSEDRSAPGDPVPFLNRPRFLDPGFRFGAAAALAPQAPGILTVDTPVVAIGMQSLISNFARGYVGDEGSCLQMNLWVPATHFDVSNKSQQRQHRFPILVFFHGGAFIFGSCHQTIANGQALCERGECIVVSCNYRMGILGYLNIPGVTCQNRGLRDQVAALEWVKRNISHFGGDPHNITVAGQSAGSMSVGALLGVEATYREKLFHKALMISGTPQYLPTREQSELIFSLCLQESQESSAETLAQKLRIMPLRDIIRLQNAVDRANAKAYRDHRSSIILAFQPFIEGGAGTPIPSPCLKPVLPYHPIDFLRHRKKHKAKQIPLLIGSTREEYTFFTRATVKMFPIRVPCVKSRVRQWVHSAFGIPLSPPMEAGLDNESALHDFASRVEEVYQQGDMSSRTGPPHATFTAINGDFLFRLPSEFLASVLMGEVEPASHPSEDDLFMDGQDASGEGHVWMYRFDRPSVMSSMGATHALDLHYFFNTWWCPPYYTGGWSRAVAQLSDTVANDLLAFMRARNVDADTLPWPRWDPKRRPQKLYGSPENAESKCVEGCDPEETAVWGDVFDRMLQARGEEPPK
jgi:carboxylesterase type B